jgi:MFS family permease
VSGLRDAGRTAPGAPAADGAPARAGAAQAGHAADARAAAQPARGARLTTWAITATAGLPLMSVAAPNVALPAIAGDLGARFDELQWIVAAYTLALASLQLAAGPLADRFGRRRATLAGLALFAAGGLAAAAAPTAPALIGARAVQGAGGALVLTGALALVAVRFGPGDRVRVLALRSAIIATAFALGPLAGGILLELIGWRAIFAFDALLALPLLAVLARAGARDARELGAGRAARIDAAGLVLLSATLVAAVFTVIRGDALGWTSAPILAGAALTAGGAAGVAWRQRRGHELVPGELLRNRILAASVLTLLTFYFAVFGAMVFLTLYLRGVCGLTPIATGLLLTAFAAAALAMVLVVTRTTRLPVGRLVTGALLLGAAGLAWVGLAAPARDAALLIPGLLALGAAAGIVNPLLTAGQLAAFRPADGGVAAGLNGTSRQFGTALGTAALGALVQLAVEHRLDPLLGDAATTQRIVAGDLGGGLAGLAPRLRPLAEEAYRAGLVSGLRASTLAGAALLLVLAPLTARWLAPARAAST